MIDYMIDCPNQVISVVNFNLPPEIIFPITPCKLLQDMIHLYLQNKYKELEVDSLVTQKDELYNTVVTVRHIQGLQGERQRDDTEVAIFV